MSVELLPLDEWNRFDREHPAPTFFARPGWAYALQETIPALAAAPLRIRLGEKTFILPTVHAARRRSPFREYIGFPLGGYTCVLDEDGALASSAQARAVVAAVAARVDHLRIFPWPLGPALPTAGPVQPQPYEAAVIDCSDGFESAKARMRGVTRRMADQALRRGVECARAGASDLHVYYAMLEEASRAWPSGKPSLSYALLESVLNHGGDDAQLWFASVHGRPIGGGIILFGADELFFWTAAMDRDASTYRPSNALNVALLRAACERRVRWYNLGASQGLQGVERFKHDLGAASIAYHEVHVRRPAFAWYERARGLFMRGNVC
ncbi:MAG TPA: GNAT family N-acetyltransferase [Candidatus Baltobacteraceae bacterium]|nr:GNAT family N-acetyltransferase [Candidatus Baltobacteraceae bacterium]